MTGEPTTWRAAPVCATEAMIEAGSHAIVREFPLVGMDTARLVARLAIGAALKAAPPPPPDHGPTERERVLAWLNGMAAITASQDAASALDTAARAIERGEHWGEMPVAKVYDGWEEMHG